MFDAYGTPTFQPIPLDNLNLRKRWKRLDTLQRETLDLTERYLQAASTVAGLEGQREAAFERDLEAHAGAIRAGEQAPEGKHVPELERQIDGAIRNRDALKRAAEGAGRDVAAYTEKHGERLRSDMADAVQRTASELAARAREAAQLFAQWQMGREDLQRLTPPPAPPPEVHDAKPQRLTTLFAVADTRATFGGGPKPGEVAAILDHLQRLASADEDEVSEVEDVADPVARTTPVEGEKPAAETIVGAVPDEGD